MTQNTTLEKRPLSESTKLALELGTRGGARPGAGRKPGRVYDVTFQVRITEDDKEAIETLSDAYGVTASELIRTLVQREYSLHNERLAKDKEKR